MRPKLAQAHGCVDRSAVVQNVQVRLLKINDARSVGPLHVSVSNIPFLGNRPVKNGSARRHFKNFKWNLLLDQSEGSPDPVSSYAPANRIELRRELVQFVANRPQPLLIDFLQSAHEVSRSPDNSCPVPKSLLFHVAMQSEKPDHPNVRHARTLR